MGSLWLHALPDYLSRWRLPFRLVDGWQTRSRSTGGFEELLGVVCHHTASQTTPANDIGFCINGSPDAPVGNGVFDRDGVFHFHTAGAANTQGKGGPWFTARGTAPLDSGNIRFVAIEAANGGAGEAWSPSQVDNYPKLVAAIFDCVTHEFPEPGPCQPNCCLSHHEWAPTRKNDPAGPSPWGGPGGTTWRMDEFRGDVFRHMLAGPTPDPEPPPPPDEEDDLVRIYVAKFRPATGPVEMYAGDGVTRAEVERGDVVTGIDKMMHGSKVMWCSATTFEPLASFDAVPTVRDWTTIRWLGVGYDAGTRDRGDRD